MQPRLFTCLFIDTDGTVVDVLRFSAADPVEAGRHAARMAETLGKDVSVELRRAGRKVHAACAGVFTTSQADRVAGGVSGL